MSSLKPIEQKKEQEKGKKRKILILIILVVLLAFCLISILVWQGLTKPDMSKTQESPVLNQVVGNYQPGEDLFLKSGGGDISILIPSCAIDQKGKIVLTPMGEYINDQVLPDSVWSRPRTAEVDFYSRSNELIEELPISCSIRVCFTLTDDEWDSYLKNSTNFDVQYLNDDTTPPSWVSLLVLVQRGTHELCGNYNRLGLYALAMKDLSTGPTGPYDILEPTITPALPELYEPFSN